jgi:hypothetical protein
MRVVLDTSVLARAAFSPFPSYPSSAWARTFRKLRFPCFVAMRRLAKQSFGKVRSQGDLGNESISSVPSIGPNGFRGRLCALVAIFVLVGPMVLGCSQPPNEPAAAAGRIQSEERQAPPDRKVRVKISKETTWILEPRDAEGDIDYLAAVNRMTGDGVTADNNAGVLFVRAFGAPELKGAERDRFFQLLGIEPLPADGDYFKELRPLSKEEQAAFDKCMLGPWKARDFPLFAEWLTSNERPLNVVIAGTRRERCYLPSVLSDETKSLISVPLLTEEASRAWARALASRAMLRLGDGNIAGAEDDLFACHRLARLIGCSPCLIGSWLTISFDGQAFACDASLMEHGRLSAADALAYQAKLRTLPPLPVMADKFGRFERINFLSGLQQSMREAQVTRGAAGSLFEWVTISERQYAYWTEVFRAGNAEFDKWEAAARLPNSKRLPVFKTLLQKLRQDASEIMGTELFDRLVADPAQAKTLGDKFRQMAGEFAAHPNQAGKLPGTLAQSKTPAECGAKVGKLLVFLLLPAITASCDAEDRGHARERLEQLGLALVAYHADHGTYPASLAVLAPKYLATVPSDPCTGQPMRYEPRSDGFLLYSVGPNGADDKGRDYESDPPGDDIVLRIPGKP